MHGICHCMCDADLRSNKTAMFLRSNRKVLTSGVSVYGARKPSLGGTAPASVDALIRTGSDSRDDMGHAPCTPRQCIRCQV
jgi:hypothetical protein